MPEHKSQTQRQHALELRVPPPVVALVCALCIINLAMIDADKPLFSVGITKAEGAYGKSIRQDLAKNTKHT